MNKMMVKELSSSHPPNETLRQSCCTIHMKTKSRQQLIKQQKNSVWNTIRDNRNNNEHFSYIYYINITAATNTRQQWFSQMKNSLKHRKHTKHDDIEQLLHLIMLLSCPHKYDTTTTYYYYYHKLTAYLLPTLPTSVFFLQQPYNASLDFNSLYLYYLPLFPQSSFKLIEKFLRIDRREKTILGTMSAI